ncbi:hypothetical protein E2C01_011144 [Portunus trituberculatus]|uniref:Uncharacterized protein n=1 Tax=Portunus trituberculatus TaxID=210409 RepID=A0A5B7DAY4_PORTR|nr:hypothetical protein [Portunus trituberculatus]
MTTWLPACVCVWGGGGDGARVSQAASAFHLAEPNIPLSPTWNLRANNDGLIKGTWGERAKISLYGTAPRPCVEVVMVVVVVHFYHEALPYSASAPPSATALPKGLAGPVEEVEADRRVQA